MGFTAVARILTGGAIMESIMKGKGLHEKDTLLFNVHDGINVLALLFVISLYFAESRLITLNYETGKTLHLLGVLWFYGGMIMAAFVLNRFIFEQPAIDLDKIADGYRFMLLLEVGCALSIGLIAIGGMAMLAQRGGVAAHAWAAEAYYILFFVPPIYIVSSRIWHRRFIKAVNINIEREKRIAFWQDWLYVIGMTAAVLFLSSTMTFDTPLP